MVRASVLAGGVSWVRGRCVVGSNPTRAALFFSSEKKELFGLVAFPFFLFYRKEFSCITSRLY